MFSKARIRRFNEEMSCAPPPTKYDPKVSDNSGGCSIDRSKRWSEKNKVTPGPYLGPVIPKELSNLTPFKQNKKMNSSTCSSASTSSQSGLFNAPKPFVRSRSFRSSNSKVQQCQELKDEVKDLTDEKKDMKNYIEKLEKELSSLKITNEASTSEINISEVGIQVNLTDTLYHNNETLTKQEPPDEHPSLEGIQDEPQDLSCPKKEKITTIPSEELQLLRDQIHHLTTLRDNLEASVAGKDDTIMDMQMQLDLIVADSEKSQKDKVLLEIDVKETRKKLEETLEELRNKESGVKDLIAKYEAFSKKHEDICKQTKEIIAKKDIEIELLNDSIATLNTQISEYERTISVIQMEVSNNRSQISSLERTVGDLSIASKGKECVESILEDEIQEKSKVVSKLESSLKEVQKSLNEMKEERENLSIKLQEEKSSKTELNKRIESLEVSLKEKEVVQQFLEKELAIREAEVSESNKKRGEMETELEIARRLALDLQEEAEVQLNQVFCLQASLSAKDYDIETKEDLISTLREEVSLKASTSLELQEKINLSQKNHAELVEEIKKKEGRIEALEENICQLKSALDKEEENNSKLEERVVQLMLENEECEKEFKRRLQEKESEVEELSVKYSDALLEQESTKRILTVTSEKLENEYLLRQAMEKEQERLQNELDHVRDSYSELEASSKNITLKLIHIEDALSCEEAESRDLQKKLEASENQVKSLENENRNLHSSNEGYASQISVLKVDMTKKSVAVEEMQNRIDELRDEKNALLEGKRSLEEERIVMEATLKLLGNTINDKETLLKDLQDEFEDSLQTITDLKSELEKKKFGIEELQKIVVEKNKDEEKRVLEFEEEKSEFFNQISLLENHLQEEKDQKIHYKTKAIEMEEILNRVEEEKRRAISSLQTQVMNEKAKVETLEGKLMKLESKYEGYEDQLKNMQTSLMDKTMEVEKWNQSYIEANLCSESYRGKMEELEKEISKLVKESEQLNKSLNSKETLLSSLNNSIMVKSDEIQSLYKDLEEKQNRVTSLEKCLEETEKSRVQLREERDEIATQIFSLQQSLDETKGQLKNTNITLESRYEDKIKAIICEYEEKIEELRRKQEELFNESESWRAKYEDLEKIVEPFRDQLDSYKMEKSFLLSKSAAAESELKKLSEEYARLIGHNNHKQKIQHLVKLKTENNELREKTLKLQSELDKQKRIIRRLEEKEHKSLKWGKSFVVSKSSTVDKDDKENALPMEEVLDPQDSSTPLKSSSQANRFRRI